MDERRVKLAVGSLLHDIGKILYRYNDGRNHSLSGYEYLKNEIKIESNEILEQVRYHHATCLKNANIEDNSLAYITYIADNIASSSDRRKNDDVEAGFDREMPLESIFNLLNNNNEKKNYLAMQLEKEINYPTDVRNGFDESFYAKVCNALKDNLSAIRYSAEYLNSLLEVLEAELSYIPSSTMKNEVADVSLYDHIKLTAAFALCIETWLSENDIDNYKEELFKNAENFYKKQAFLLFSMDMSGIQDFIYTIASKDALKSLRSRSFYLEMLMENFVDELLDRTDVSRANLLYSGGGHAYIILPNTENVKQRIVDFEKECNEWLLKEFGTKLFLACGYAECSTLELQNKPERAYRNIFKKISEMLSEKKIHRYTAEQIIILNKRTSEHELRECKVCRVSEHLMEEDICQTCDSLIKMSGNILYKGFYAVTEQSNIYPVLPLPYGKNLVARNKEDLIEQLKKDEIIRVYSKNEAYTGLNMAKRLWVGDYTNGETFEELALGAQGVDRIAVLRADVDSLGNAFVNGFVSERYGERYVTLSRTATFSRKMSMFFKYHINSILEDGENYIGNEHEDKKRKITIVYSGGDDVFVVGSWDEVIGFAVDLHQKFKRFSQGTLTISAGIGIYPGKYPISSMAREVGELETCAKSYPDKNAVCLFEPDLTFSWEDLIQNVLGEKLTFLKEFFQLNPDKGNAFLYRIVEMIRGIDKDGDKLNLARLAYLLSRLEESVRKKNEKGDINIQKLSKQIYEWVKDTKERKYLLAAIYLYVYLNRQREE